MTTRSSELPIPSNLIATPSAVVVGSTFSVPPPGAFGFDVAQDVLGEEAEREKFTLLDRIASNTIR